MSRAFDFLSIALLAGAIVCFALSVNSLADQHDVRALYWLAVGVAALRAATDILRPSTSAR